MLKRAFFASTAIFWVIMMTLLWRAEFRGEGNLASSIPPEVVWEKILTAPDDSTLSISVNKRKIGYCRWTPNIADPEGAGKIASENRPDGLFNKLAGYTVTVEGSYLFEEDGSRLRFEAEAGIRTNYTWRTLDIKGSVKPMHWSINADAVRQKLALMIDDGRRRYGHTFSFAQLQNPSALLQALGMPSIPLPLAPLNSLTNNPNITLGLDWKAQNDTLWIGPSQLRVYRLRAKLIDRHEIAIIVSRVGEILRIELPNDLVLVNDTLMVFGNG